MRGCFWNPIQSESDRFGAQLMCPFVCTVYSREVSRDARLQCTEQVTGTCCTWVLQWISPKEGEVRTEAL